MCHQSVRADYNEAHLYADWDRATELARDEHVNRPRGYPVDDPLEAAVASGCSCLSRHAAVLSDLPPFDPPSDWSPEEDGG